MKKFKLLFKTIIEYPLSFALFSGLLTAFLGGIVFRPFFEEGDDLGMSMIAEGVYGSRDCHLVISNALLGKIINGLSSMMPSVRWYMVLQFIMIIIAIILFAFMMAHYRNGRKIAVIVEFACLYQTLVAMQFTKTATLVGILSLMVLTDFIRRKYINGDNAKREFSSVSNALQVILAYILLTYSILLRDDAFLMALAAAMILLFALLVANRKQIGVRSILMTASMILPVLLLFFLLKFVNAQFYKGDWEYYDCYNEARAELIDRHYDALDYSTHGSELNALGVSENDAFMYVTWQFADDKVVTADLMNSIADITSGRQISVDMLKALVSNVYNTFFRFDALIISAMFFACLMFSRARFISSASLLCWLEVLFFAVCLFYYQYGGRWSNRVAISSMIALFIVLSYALASFDVTYYSLDDAYDRKYCEWARSLGAILGIILIATLGQRLGNEFEYQEYLRGDKDFAVMNMYIQEEKDTLFVADTFTVGDMYKYNIFTALEEKSLDNMVTCGGWLTASPILDEVVNKYGFFDPFDALRRGEDKVILIDNLYPDRKAVFLSEHGDGPRYAAEYIENVSGYNLYRIK